MSNEFEQEIADLTAAYEAEHLPKAAYQAAVSALRQQASPTYQADADRGSAVAQNHSIALAEGATFTYYAGEPTDDPIEALKIYRGVLLSNTSTLPLRGVDVGASDPNRARALGVANVYIDLDTTTLRMKAPFRSRPFDDPEWVRKEGPSGEVVLSAPVLPPEGDEKEIRPYAALEATIANRRLVLTGDPGGGKSTFVNHLAHCLAAHALYPDDGWLEQLPGWPENEATLLPIVVTLRDFAVTLDPEKKAAPGTLWQFIADQLQAQNLAFAKRAVETELREGRAIVLLDGLDEVTGTARRQRVRDAVAAFARPPFAGNRFLVTCRILFYQPPDEDDQPDLRLDTADFPVFKLAPFDEPKIDRFIDAWYRELARVGSVRPQDVDGLTGKLKTAVRRPDLWRLAPNPLLLTVMALVHADRGRLPDARALLYDQTIDMLLWRWDEVKPGGGTATLRQLLDQSGRDDTDFVRVLWRLAHDAQGRSLTEDGDEALADISEAQLTRALVKLKPDDWQWAHQMVAAMKLRAGLLLERSPGVFTFPHRTFQEYLSGAHLSVQTDCAEEAARLAAAGAVWREPILLAAGRLVHVGKDVSRALTLVQRLCPSTASDDEPTWRSTWLAGDALLEIGRPKAEDDDWGRELLDRVRDRLAALVYGGHLTPRERVDAGNTLAELGDKRPGVGVRVVAGREIPDIQLCYVPEGPFWMGSPDADKEADNDEKPLHKLDIPYGFWIGRYPVTVAQWRAFCRTAGYTRRDTDSLSGVANHPAIWITWYDAVAFGRWLTETGQQDGWLPEGWQVTLPSEAEWEKAARGGLELPDSVLTARLGEPLPHLRQWKRIPNGMQQRRYPWGNADPEPNRANHVLTGLRGTSPVGAFPEGMGPYGALDMSGNVFEWMRSSFKDYERFMIDDCVELDTVTDEDWLVRRGGSCWDDSSWLRCAFRCWFFPDDRFNFSGFRVVVSPISHR